MSTDRPTPETDTANAGFDSPVVSVKFAKRLERQRDIAIEALRDLVKINEAQDEAIGSIAWRTYMGHPHGWGDGYLDKARAALADIEKEKQG